MIKLEMGEQQVKKVMEIYDDSCYNYDNKPKTTLFAALKEKIENVINTGSDDSDKIVSKFLEKNFCEKGNVSEDMIRAYLQKKNITAVIVDFWSCVADVWLDKLKNDKKNKNVRADFEACLNGVTAAQIAQRLSKWGGVREYVMNWKENGAKKEECLDLVGTIITTKTFPLFHIPYENTFKWNKGDEADLKAGLDKKFEKQMENQKPFEFMKFRYHTDVFGEGAGKGALDKIGEIFDYKLLSGAPRHRILSAIYVPVCPYCNRQYITKYGQTGQEKTTADLDHFYHKSLYPFLALSVYNFVPSCSICNRNFKKVVDFYATPHLYPYAQQSNAEMKFKMNDIKLLWEIRRWKDDGVEKKLAVRIEPGKNVDGDREKAVVNNKRAFHLEEVYQSHMDQVSEIMCRALVYSDKRIRDLCEAFSIVDQKNSSRLFSGKEEILDMVFGQYLNEEEMYKRPLAKMAHDLLEDLLPEIEEIKRNRGWQA